MLDSSAVVDVAPVQTLALELAEPLPPSCAGTLPGGTGHYAALSVLVRLHGVPLATARLPVADSALDAGQLAALLTEQVLGPVNAHLLADGYAPVLEIPAAGLRLQATRCAELDHPTAVTSLSVVVPTVGRDVLRVTLSALAAQKDVAGLLKDGTFEVVVVDNAPARHDTRLLLQEFPGVRYVAEPRPGVAHARNRGLAECTGEVVAFVDDDTTVDPGWMRALLLAFDREPAAVCVTGLVLPSEQETAPQQWFEQYGGFAKGLDRVVHDRTANPTNSPIYPYLPGSFGTGANAAFRTEWLRAHGGFDPALGGGSPCVGGEDIDVLLRVVLGGDRLVYEPRALAWHPPHREMDTLRWQMYDYGRGLSAVLTKAALTDPRVAWDIARRIPLGLRFLLASGSPKNAHKDAGYPRELSRREWSGFLAGPGSYLLARRRLRRAAQS
jgi:GT2 family glycosyltransferase